MDFTISQFGSFEDGVISEDFHRKNYIINENLPSEDFKEIDDENDALLYDWLMPYTILEQFRLKAK